jgi:hypothetical protein
MNTSKIVYLPFGVKYNPPQNKKRKNKKVKIDVWQILLLRCKGLDYNCFLKSKYWQRIKKIILKRDNYKCTVCGADKNLQIHHSTYKYHLAEHKHLNTLLTLCEKCHYGLHCIKDIV